MNSGKTCDLIEMLFQLVGRVDPRNHVLNGGPNPPMVRGKI